MIYYLEDFTVLMRKHSLSSPSRHQYEIGIICILYLSLWIFQNLSFRRNLWALQELWVVMSGKSETEKQEEKRRWGDENSWWRIRGIHVQSQPESELVSSKRKGHQDLAPLALSPGVGTGDTQIALATFREIKQVGEHHGSHIGEGHCYEVRCTFQESEGWSLGSQRLAKIPCCSGDMLKPPVFEGSDEKELWSKPSSSHFLRVLRITSVQPKGVAGLKPPYHLEWEGPHGHPTGSEGSRLVGYRPFSGTWSANILCHFGWWIFFLIPFLHNNFCFEEV